jgi:hypothetical protein
MSVAELEKENKLQEHDILHISQLVVQAIDLTDFVQHQKTVIFKESILDYLVKMLEMMLTSDISLSREKKIEAVHLLSKLKANKEHMELVKGSLVKQQQTLSAVYTASEHMFKKSQSAFGDD